MSRVALMRVSNRLPPLPITQQELIGIWNAVRSYPITGNPVLDFRLLILTGVLESAFKSGTITPPNGESSALGYFQIINSVRKSIGKRINVPWDDSVATQAKYAAYGYAELANMIRRHKVKVFPFSSDPLANLLLNTRFRYIVGTGSKYLGHRDAQSFWTKTMKYYPFLAQGEAQVKSHPTSVNDSENMKIQLAPEAERMISSARPNIRPFQAGPYAPFIRPEILNRIFVMNPIFNEEFPRLPKDVKDTFISIVNSFTDAFYYISSIKSSFNGQPRTVANGINHHQHKAVDFVITPYDTPFFIAQDGQIRSPNYHWNAYLKQHLLGLYDDGLITSSVLIEPDHIHIDSNHEPGLSIKNGDKNIYPNLSGFCSDVTIARITGHA